MAEGIVCQSLLLRLRTGALSKCYVHSFFLFSMQKRKLSYPVRKPKELKTHIVVLELNLSSLTASQFVAPII